MAAAPPAAAKLDLRNERRSRSSVSLNLRWCSSKSGQFLSSPAHIFSLPWFEKDCLLPTRSDCPAKRVPRGGSEVQRTGIIAETPASAQERSRRSAARALP